MFAVEGDKVECQLVVVVQFDAFGHERHHVADRSHQAEVNEAEQCAAVVVVGADHLEKIGQVIGGCGSIDLGFAIRAGWDDHIGQVDVEFFADDVVCDPVIGWSAGFGDGCLGPEHDVNRFWRSRRGGFHSRLSRSFGRCRFFSGCGGWRTGCQYLTHNQKTDYKDHFPAFHLLLLIWIY